MSRVCSAATLSITSGIGGIGLQTLEAIGAGNTCSKNHREEHFRLNLSRMAGRTDAVSPDTMMEFCVHLNNETIAELQSIEQDYTAELFNDANLDMVVCSIEYLINQYESAKKEKDEAFLRKLRDAHRKAVKCLDRPGVKQTISIYLANRREQTKRKMYFDFLHPILDYIEYFGLTDRTGQDLARILPSLESQETLNQIFLTGPSTIGR